MTLSRKTLGISIEYHYAECCFAECRNAEGRYPECRFAECRGAVDYANIL
jgi:hypothetical protein